MLSALFFLKGEHQLVKVEILYIDDEARRLRVQALLEASKAPTSAPEAVYTTAQRTLRLAVKQPDAVLLGEALINYLGILDRYSQIDESAELHSQWEDRVAELNQPVLSARFANSKGILLLKTGKPQDAVEIFKDTIDHFPSDGSAALKMSLQVNLANAYTDSYSYERAAQVLYDTLKETESAGDLHMGAFVHNTLGRTMHKLSNFEEALEHFKKAYDLAKDSDDFALRSAIYCNICAENLAIGNLDEGENGDCSRWTSVASANSSAWKAAC